MRRTVLLNVVVLGLALLVPAGAHAATTLGTTAASTGENTCSPDTILWETDPAFTVPAGGGVITSMATTTDTGAGTITFKVIRGTTVIGTSTQVAVATGLDRVTVHIPVTGGEYIGMYENSARCSTGAPGSALYVSSAGGDPPVGTSFASPVSVGQMLAVQATLEPDADHDGFGDETEDSCPQDAAIHTGSCTADLGLAQSVVPATIGLGDVAVATVTITNPDTRTATGLALGATVTPGLQIVATIPSAGCAFTPALSCPLGSLGGGANTVAAVVVKGVATGAQSVSTGISATSPDPGTANNTATTALAVERRAAVVCAVPKLTGLTRAFAKTLLTAVNCKLGRVRRIRSGKGRRGTVVRQSAKPRTVLAAGSKVGITLKK